MRRPRQSAAADNDDVGDEAPTLGFSSMRNSLPDIDAIEKTAARQLQALEASVMRLDGNGNDTSSTDWSFDDDNDDDNDGHRQRGDTITANSSDEVEVKGFLSHQPQYKQSLVAKKLLLYEKQLLHCSKQIETLQKMQLQARETIAKLQSELQDAQQELTSAQEDWEEEKAMLMRFRGASNAGNGAGAGIGLGQVKLNGAARHSRLKELELQKQSEMKMQLLRGAAEAQEQLDANGVDDSGLAAMSSGRFRVTMKKFRLFLKRKLYPFATDVRQIEARFGYSVASYFKFFRWIIMSFIAISIPCLVFLVLHILYKTTQLGADWTSFSGMAPRFLLISGYSPDEALIYSGIMMLTEVLLLLFTLHKWVAEDEMSKALEVVEGGDRKPKYSKIILNAWDFSLTTMEEVGDLKKSIAEQVKLAIEEEKLAETLKQRTRKERYRLYTRRVAAFLIYLVIQASSWYLIILLTTQSSEIQEQIATNAAFLAPYASTLVPAVVTIINSILPTIISLLTMLEKWDDVGFSIKAMVIRLYLAKMLNVLIQLFSYALLLNPYLLTSVQKIARLVTVDGSKVRKNVMLKFKPDTYECRAEQVASGLLTLVITDFTISKVVGVASPFIGVAVKKLKLVWQRFSEKRKQSKTKSAVVVPSSEDDESSVAANQTSEQTESGDRPPEPPGDHGSTTLAESAEVKPATEPSDNAVASVIAASSKAPDSVPPTTSTSTQVTKSEFLVPQKMVALLYSCTIALLAIPLAPTTAMLALGLHLVNFKFDKFYLTHFQRKPTNPWSAKDAGNFFIKFYFCTILVFLGWTHYFLATRYLPKQCALQDTLLESVQDTLCAANTYAASTETCTISALDASAAYFSISLGGGQECTTGYPHCICSGKYACGPFIASVNGYAPMVAAILTTDVVSDLYALLVESNFVAWLLLSMLVLLLFFLRNSLKVYIMITLDREQEVALTFTSLKKKIKQLENRVRLHSKLAESGSGGAATSAT